MDILTVCLRFEQCSFQMPDEEPAGVWKSQTSQKSSDVAHLQIAVHHGSMEQMVAMATVEMDDLDSLVGAWTRFLKKLNDVAY